MARLLSLLASSPLAWHDFNGWQQIRPLGNVPHCEILVYLAVAIELFGGIAIQWSRTARVGALVLGTIYLIFALLWVPYIMATPQVYDRWGNFFEQFSIVSGALIAYASVIHCDPARAARLARIGIICFGICVISFTLEQFVYLSGTADFVPKWIPPRQMFWAIITTIALGPRGHCATVGTFGATSISITHGDAGRLRIAGMATGSFSRSA